jgi:hypothetical protein
MRRLHGLVPACLLVLVTGCSGGGSDAKLPEAEPAPSRAGEVTPIDVCDLVGRQAMGRALGERVRVVGRELDPPTLPTETCLW